MCEGWGAGFLDRRGREEYGYAFHYYDDSPDVINIEVKSFVTEETSITSTVWIKDSIGEPVLEVTHRYGPAAKVPGALFQALVTMTNISGDTLRAVKYNRTMDWDVPPTEFYNYVTIKGAAASAASSSLPKVLHSGDQGFMRPNVWNPSSLYNSERSEDDSYNIDDRFGPENIGHSATMEFGDLLCGEAHTFMIYYGATENKAKMEAAFAAEDVPFYSMGWPNERTTSWRQSGRRYGNFFKTGNVTFGFGFKGVSGTAIAPSLPTKTAILPGGIETDESLSLIHI